MTNLIKTDERYKKWISDVSKRFRCVFIGAWEEIFLF